MHKEDKCDHCDENEATVICPECGSQWCKNCVSPRECLTCGADLSLQVKG